VHLNCELAKQERAGVRGGAMHWRVMSISGTFVLHRQWAAEGSGGRKGKGFAEWKLVLFVGTLVHCATDTLPSRDGVKGAGGLF